MLAALAGCSTVTPQRIDLCTEYVLYDSVEAFQRAAPENRLLFSEGYYDKKGNVIHAYKWDFETLGHETYHAMRQRGWPRLIIDRGFEHWAQ